MVFAVVVGVVVLTAVVAVHVYRRPRSLPDDTGEMPTKNELSPKQAHLSSGPPASARWGVGG